LICQLATGSVVKADQDLIPPVTYVSHWWCRGGTSSGCVPFHFTREYIRANEQRRGSAGG